MAKLALHGGQPVRRDPWPKWPQWGEAEVHRLHDVLESGEWGGFNETVGEFENSFAKRHKAKHCIAAANGTLTLEAALRVLGVGYGDVLERDPEQIMSDIRAGLCTHWAAKELYKVSYDENTLRLDAEKTDILREEARKDRLKRAMSYDDFQKDWLKLRPSEETLEYYGTYPHPRDGLAAS